MNLTKCSINAIVFGVTTLMCVISMPLLAQDTGKSITKILDFVNGDEDNLTVETLDRLTVQLGAEIVNG